MEEREATRQSIRGLTPGLTRRLKPRASSEARIQNDDDDERTASKPSTGSPLSISETAFSLTSSIAKICGHSDDFIPPSWAGAPMRVQSWLNQGWTAEQIDASCREQIAKRRGVSPNSITYFERGIAEFVARLSAPLPTAPQKTETTYGRKLTPHQQRLAEMRAFLEQRRRDREAGRSDDGQHAHLRATCRYSPSAPRNVLAVPHRSVPRGRRRRQRLPFDRALRANARRSAHRARRGGAADHAERANARRAIERAPKSALRSGRPHHRARVRPTRSCSAGAPRRACHRCQARRAASSTRKPRSERVRQQYGISNGGAGSATPPARRLAVTQTSLAHQVSSPRRNDSKRKSRHLGIRGRLVGEEPCVDHAPDRGHVEVR